MTPSDVGRPRHRRLGEPQLGAAARGELEVRGDRLLGPDEPRDRLVQPHLVVRRESSSGTGAGSPRRRGARAAGPTPGPRAGCRPPSGRRPRPGRGRRSASSARGRSRPPAGPTARRPAQQRHVGGVLEVGLPDDPRPAVAGALVVRGAEPLEAEHPGTPRRPGARPPRCPCHRVRSRSRRRPRTQLTRRRPRRRDCRCALRPPAVPRRPGPDLRPGARRAPGRREAHPLDVVRLPADRRARPQRHGAAVRDLRPAGGPRLRRPPDAGPTAGRERPRAHRPRRRRPGRACSARSTRRSCSRR